MAFKRISFGAAAAFFSIAAVSCTAAQASAATFLSAGTIIDNTTWTKANSPYVINGDLTVAASSTLTIEPGAIVKFECDSSSGCRTLRINGKLIADGIPQDKIYLTTLADDSIGGDTMNDGDTFDYALAQGFGWALYVDGATSSSFSNAVVKGLVNFDFSNMDMAIRNVDFSYIYGGVSSHNGNFQVINSTFTKGSNGISTDSGNLTVSSSTFSGITYPITMGIGSLIVSTSSFSDFGNPKAVLSGDKTAAIYADQGIVSVTNSIFDNGQQNGLVFLNSTSTVASSTISHMNLKQGSGAGIWIIGGSFNGAKLSITDDITGLLMQDDPRFNAIISSSTLSQSRIIGNGSTGMLNTAAVPMNARNNWWGDATGPFSQSGTELNTSGLGDHVDGNVLFTPWLTADPWTPQATSTPTTTSSLPIVVFIPGIEASRLYKQKPNCATLTCEDQLWDPNINADAVDLFMNPDGSSIDSSIYTRDVIDRAGPPIFGVNVYKNFLTTMGNEVGNSILVFKPLPYDWRYDITDVVNKGTDIGNGNISYAGSIAPGTLPYMIDQIKKLTDASPNNKVTIIAHSMGGLVAKELIQKLQVMKASGQNNLIDKINHIILIAVPEIGTPDAIPVLLHGYGQNHGNSLILDEKTAIVLGQNTSSAYNLLPSIKYFSSTSTPVITFDSSSYLAEPGFKKYGASISSANVLQQFLLGTLDKRPKPSPNQINIPNILNSALLAKAAVNHATLDDWKFPVSMEVDQIAGWGNPTMTGIKYVSEEKCDSQTSTTCSQVLDLRPIFTRDGDDTVLSLSAIAQASSTKTLYVDLLNTKLSHKSILELPDLQELIKNLLTGNNSLPQSISTQKPHLADLSNILVSVHSPVSIDAYDAKGNHTGIITNPDPNSDLEAVENNIPGSSYMELGDGKYIVLANGNYNLDIQGQGYGTFIFEKQTTSSMGIGTTSVYADIPVTPLTDATVIISPTTTPLVQVDADGDGTTDFTVKATDKFDPIVYLEAMKKTVLAFNLGTTTTQQLLQKISNVEEAIQKGKIKNAETKIKLLMYRASHKRWKKNKIPADDKQILVNSLNQLLDNLK